MLWQINDSGTNLLNGPINLPTRSLAHLPTFSGLMHLLANFTPVELSPTDINLPLVHARTRTHTHTHPHPPTHPLTHPPRVSLYRTGAEMWHAFPFFFPRLGVQWRGQSALNTKLRKHTHTHTYAYCRYIDIVHCQICSSHVSQVEVRIGMTPFFFLVQSTEFLNVRRWEPLRPETRVAVPWLGWDTPGSTPYPHLDSSLQLWIAAVCALSWSSSCKTVQCLR